MYYIDMDGVVADFKKWIESYKTFSEDEWRYTNEPWSVMEDNIDVVYYNLQPTNLLPGFVNLYNTGQAKFLTALPKAWKDTEYWDIAAENKTAWLEKYVHKFKREDIIITPGAGPKIDYCQPGDFLFDDRWDTIQRWNEAGGIGIRVEGSSD